MAEELAAGAPAGVIGGLGGDDGELGEKGLFLAGSLAAKRAKPLARAMAA